MPGWANAAVRFVHEHLAANTFVSRTDVKSYYASIDHDILLGLLEEAASDRRVLDLLLHVEQHPDKMFIGRISRGIDFLGYAFTSAGLDAAPQAVELCIKRVSRLYEQCVDLIHIGTHVRR